eukprot:TRINITY_DN109_c0_g1_i2.p1 TRINITY_DN109_c0_g1~~TRINITY_DN109_c0_g1_i2.p1  ORF type:complete len:327 (-),score=79.62 TRINITY_DN109_c0_g1_i2:129-1109(-)
MIHRSDSLAQLSIYNDTSDTEPAQEEEEEEEKATESPQDQQENSPIKSPRKEVSSIVDYYEHDDDISFAGHERVVANAEVAAMISSESSEHGKGEGQADEQSKTITETTSLDTTKRTLTWHPSLPPEPEVVDEAVDEKLKQKLSNLHSLHQNGKKITTTLLHTKSFTNPDIMEKLISYCSINEFGSEYPKELFDYQALTESETSQSLAEKQAQYQEKLEQEKIGRTCIEFEKSGQQTLQTSAVPPHLAVQYQQSRPTGPGAKTSKWDCMVPSANLKKPTPAVPIAPNPTDFNSGSRNETILSNHQVTKRSSSESSSFAAAKKTRVS